MQGRKDGWCPLSILSWLRRCRLKHQQALAALRIPVQLRIYNRLLPDQRLPGVSRRLKATIDTSAQLLDR